MATLDDSEGFKRLIQSCKVVFDIYPEMLRDMIINRFPPVILEEKIQRAGINFVNNLQTDEKAIIRRIRSKGYSDMDGSMLYKLIRHFELVISPSAGWGTPPKPQAINQGDDVERLRFHRNRVIHRATSTMTPTESQLFFLEFHQCAERLDQYLQRPSKVFTDKITRVQSHTVDDAASLTYHKQFEETLQLKEETYWYTQASNRRPRITFRSSKFIREETDNCEKREAGSKDFFMVCHGFDDENVDNIIKVLNQNFLFINNKDCPQIKVNGVGIGSVVIHVSITIMTFVSLKKLVEQVQSFVNMILGISEVNKRIKHDLDIMLIPIDFINIKVSEKEYTLQCENCNASLQPDSKFCHICGGNIDKKSLCSKCKSIVSKEHNFCPTCGEKLRQDALETTELAQGEHQIEQIVQEQNAIKDLHAQDQMQEENQGERVFRAQSAIRGPESLAEVKQLMKKINEEGSKKFMEHLNKTLDKWKKEKVKFGLAGSSTMGKSSFVNVLTGHTEDNENRAKTSAGGNTTLSTTEYSDARQKSISFFDFPGYGTPSFTYQAYFEQKSSDTLDYVLIFFYVVSLDDIQFAKSLDEKKKKFCFVRTKLDIDIDSAKYDNPEGTDPQLIAETLRQTAVDSIEKQGLLNPIVFVISNRRTDLGHFPNLHSHIEQVLHKEKYQALIYEISTYTRDAIKRKHKLLCDRINSVTMQAVVEEGEDATDFDYGNVEEEKKRIKLQKTVQWLERELLFYIETFELNKKTSIALIGQERVRKKLKFASLLTSCIENYIADFITKRLDFFLDKPRNDQQIVADDDEEQCLEYPFLHPSRKLLSEVLDGLQEDAFIIFEEFQKEEC